MISEEILQITRIFHPFYVENYERVLRDNIRFVHYTSAEAALGMLKHKNFWMRNARVMNDFSEVEYGCGMLVSAYRSPLGGRLKKALGTISATLQSDLEAFFDGWRPRFPEATYLTSFSEHDAQEDEMGRLSMWRAYGGASSIAVVLNNHRFLSPTDVLTIFSSPVLYADQDHFNAEFEKLVTNIETNSVLLSADPEMTHTRLFNAFLAAALCTKRPGFKEEREWRVIHTEGVHPSTNLAKEIELIGGVPQFIYKIPLRNIEGAPGQIPYDRAEIKDLLDRVIVGPSQHGQVVRDAVVSLLEEAGVTDASTRVYVSGIPLRSPF